MLAPRSSIVFVSSAASLRAGTGIPSYDSSKAALLGLARQTAREAAPNRSRANVIVPGYVDTPMGRMRVAANPNRARRLPLGRQATPWEVAYGAIWLLSNESSYMTAQSLVLDGGDDRPAVEPSTKHLTPKRRGFTSRLSAGPLVPRRSGGALLTDEPLRVALLTYRGNPFCGGQGVYVRHLSRELVAARATRSTCSPARPTRCSTPASRLVEVPSLDLYREPDPFRMPRLRRVPRLGGRARGGHHDDGRLPRADDVLAARAAGCCARRRARYDVVHDNQSLGLRAARGWACRW